MKIRNGYVSNSSSSSFLIVYKDIKEFEKFQVFNEKDSYQEFMSDLKSSTESDGVNLIETFIEDYLYAMKNNFVNQMNGKEAFYSYEDIRYKCWCDLPYDYKYKDKGVNKKLETLRECTNISVEEVEKKFHKMNFKNEAKKFVEFLKEQGYNVRAIEYSDDSNFGCYMEHYFMPFVARCPEGDFRVYIQSNH